MHVAKGKVYATSPHLFVAKCKNTCLFATKNNNASNVCPKLIYHYGNMYEP
jgi:hypothetical protein